MSNSNANGKRTRVQKICTLWTHDDNFSRDDVVFNVEKFTELPATPGSLIQVIALKYGTATRDFQSSSRAPKGNGQSKIDDPSENASPSLSRRGRKGSIKRTLDENGSVSQEDREVDMDKSYIFVAKPFPADLKSKHSNLQVSIAEKIAKVFGLRSRMQVIVTLVSYDRYPSFIRADPARPTRTSTRRLMLKSRFVTNTWQELTCGACRLQS